MPLIVNFTLAASETSRNKDYDPFTEKVRGPCCEKETNEAFELCA